MTPQNSPCPNCGYELAAEVDVGSGQKARMGSFSDTCPICNHEINPPKEPSSTRSGFRSATSPKKPAAKFKGGKKQKKKN